MTIDSRKIQELISILETTYPGWKGFSDPRLSEDESNYKRSAMEKAQELLNQREMQHLIFVQKDFEQVIRRLEKVGRSTNLLFQGVPKFGDLNILYQDGLDKPGFCKQMFDLLYGTGSSPERLGRYIKFVQANNLPNKWTFPTYFLYMLMPQTEMFVKPTTIQKVLKLVGRSDEWSSKPNEATYQSILQLAIELKNGLQKYNPIDMVDIQSFMFICAYENPVRRLSKKKEGELTLLLEEFALSYPPSPEGQKHIQLYRNGREQAVKNYSEIIAKVEQGQDVTDEILLKLLPYADSSSNREKGAWIHIAPAINGDLKKWFENTGWTEPDDWPRIAQAILKFVQLCLSDPEKLSEACAEFSTQPYSKGFQSGMITPILNALNPDQFVLINNKSRKTLSYFTGINYDQTLTHYPEINRDALIFIEEVNKILRSKGIESEYPCDLFDMFSHWLVAIKKFTFKNDNELAFPFSEMFANLEQANQIFDFFKEAADALGLKTSDHPLAVFTIHFNQQAFWMNFNYGNWQVAGISGRSKKINKFRVALFTNNYPISSITSGHFRTKPGEQEFSLYSFPMDAFGSFKAKVMGDYTSALQIIASRFSTWVKSPFIRHHNPKIASAVFDLSERMNLFQEGLMFEELEGGETEGEELEGGETEGGEPVKHNPPYSFEDWSHETSFDIFKLIRWVKAIERKGQVILYGPPGTGKTYMAERMARHLVAEGDGFVEIVQFHPAYSYEDFVQGIRPKARLDGGLEYPLIPGRFLKFCKLASQRNNNCVLIIDEINRANLARVFGELMYLLEYRNKEIQLASGETFKIPANVRIIGTMNTADRSIALVDHALRRRFAFLEIYPEMGVLKKYHDRSNFNVEGLIYELQKINQRINDPHYYIGISYFLREDLPNQIEDIWTMEIEPYLQEYFFDHPDWAKEFSWSKVKDKILPGAE